MRGHCSFGLNGSDISQDILEVAFFGNSGETAPSFLIQTAPSFSTFLNGDKAVVKELMARLI